MIAFKIPWFVVLRLIELLIKLLTVVFSHRKRKDDDERD